MNKTRRRFTDEEKLKILAETVEVEKNGGKVADVAKKYQLYNSAIYEWRKMAAKGKLKPTEKANGVKEIEEGRPLGDAMIKLLGPVALVAKSHAFLRVAPCPICNDGLGWRVELEDSVIHLCDRGGLRITYL